MKFLVTNDDGVYSPGIRFLVTILNKFGKVIVVAPDSERSGFSQSITTKKPLLISKILINDLSNVEWYKVNGTPADCVKISMHTIFSDDKPDYVLSGINIGENLGQDYFYSGTIAAARESLNFRIPSIAISVARDKNNQVYFDFISEDIELLLKKIFSIHLDNDTLLNINYPSINKSISRFLHKVVPMETETYRFTYDEYFDPKGRKTYWLRNLLNDMPENEEADFTIAKQDTVTISPIQRSTPTHNNLKSFEDYFNY